MVKVCVIHLIKSGTFVGLIFAFLLVHLLLSKNKSGTFLGLLLDFSVAVCDFFLNHFYKYFYKEYVLLLFSDQFLDFTVRSKRDDLLTNCF